MSSYYNNIPIYETINVNYGNIETLDTTTLKTKNLYIDNVKSSNKIITQNLTLDTDNIESLSKSNNPSYTADNNKIPSKGYVDEAIHNIPATDLSECVKNNIDQTLTNKIIMNNSNNEITTKNLTINTSKTITNTTASSSSPNTDDDIIATKYYVDNLTHDAVYEVDKVIEFINTLTYSDFTNNGLYLSFTTTSSITISGYTGVFTQNKVYKATITGTTISFEEKTLDNKIIVLDKTNNRRYFYYDNILKNIDVGQSNLKNGEVFNDYTNNVASGEYSHAEGWLTTASGNNSHTEGKGTTASGTSSHAEGWYTTASGHYSHAEGRNTTASGELSFCRGSGSIASGKQSFCVGNNCYTTADYSYAIGISITADQSYQTAIGSWNTTSNTNALLSVGNGNGIGGNRSDALVVKYTGEVIINSTRSTTTPSLTIGPNSKSITGTTGASNSTQADDAIIATKYYVDKSYSNCTIRIRYKTTSNIYNYIDINTFGFFVFKSSTEIYFTGDLLINKQADADNLNPFVCIEYLQCNGIEYIVPNSTPYDQPCLLFSPDTRSPNICYLYFERNPLNLSNPYFVYLIKFISYDNHVMKNLSLSNYKFMIKLNYVNFVKKVIL